MKTVIVYHYLPGNIITVQYLGISEKIGDIGHCGELKVSHVALWVEDGG
jgi:hypothetical protein